MELDRLHRDPPTMEEIKKVRNIVEANFFSENEDVMGQAYSLAYFESLGGYEKMTKYVDRMRSVSPSEIIRVVEQYLTFQNMSLMEYVPKKIGMGAAYDLRLENLRKRVVAGVERAGPSHPLPDVPLESLPLEISSKKSEKPEDPIEAISVGGGVTLLYLQRRTLPLVSAGVYFPGGRSDETPENCGITQFVLRSTLKGTENRTADEISFEVESLGSSIKYEASADTFGYSINVLNRNLDQAMHVLSDVALHPTFTPQEMEKERTSVLAKIRQSRDDMFHYPIELFYSSLYGLHPYGLPRNGREETIEALTRPQLLEWYQEMFTWRRMVVVIVGDVSREEAKDLVEKHFAVSGDSDEEHRAEIIPVLPDRGIREKIEDRDRRQTGVALGFGGVSLKDNRYFALEVLRNILSGMGGRLFMELREKRALAYTVTAFNIGLLRGGAFFTYIATSPDREMEARDALLEELVRIVRGRPTVEELTSAKEFSKGSHAISLQANGAVGYEHVHQFMAGRGLEAINTYNERIDAVTMDQLHSIASEIIDLDQCAVGIVRGRSA